MSRPQRTVGTRGTGGGFAVPLASPWLRVTTVLLTTVLCCFPASTHSTQDSVPPPSSLCGAGWKRILTPVCTETDVFSKHFLLNENFCLSFFIPFAWVLLVSQPSSLLGVPWRGATFPSQPPFGGTVAKLGAMRAAPTSLGTPRPWGHPSLGTLLFPGTHFQCPFLLQVFLQHEP